MKKIHTNLLFSFSILFAIFNVATVTCIEPQQQLRDGDGLETKKSPIISTKYPVDLSFIIVDLKYNETKGIQICEIQQGSVSKFKGYDFLYGKEGIVANNFVQALANYQQNVWYYSIDFVDREFKARFQKEGYNRVVRIDTLFHDKQFKKASHASVYDPYNIHNYHGIYMGRISPLADSVADFRGKFPGIIPMDAAFLEFRTNKLAMNQFLSSNEALKRFKPDCGVFEKGYTPTLAKNIIDTIGSEIFVIKPIGAYRGNGVIIVRQEDLDDTLKYIFSGSKELKHDPDSSYRWWSKDKRDLFIVEEFVPSDPVYVPHLNDLPYDGTMRVALLIAYSDQEISIHFIESHWKLPMKPLTEEGTLNEIHKSFAEPPNYEKVSDEMQKVLQQQLTEAVSLLYQEILTSE